MPNGVPAPPSRRLRTRQTATMARNRSRVNVEWTTPASGWTWDHVALEVLMDIRAELQKLNALLHCHNFTGIPTTLRSIRKAMPVRKPRKRTT
jgi:hypothetical protein